MNKIVRFSVVIISMLIFAGCGKSQPEITADTAPFENAVATYCRAHNYGMKVKEFVSLQVNGSQADAVAKMEEAGGTYGLAVKWEFKFQKQDGKWKVTSYKAK